MTLNTTSSGPLAAHQPSVFEQQFGLHRRPFPSIPDPQHYHPAGSIESARSSLVRLIDRHEGAAMVVGQAGLGKSLLCQLIAESFRHRCRVVRLACGRISNRRSLLQNILYELGLPYRDAEEGELRLSLTDYVTNSDLCPDGMLLLVDEADTLSPALIEELRTLTNLVQTGQSCIRLVLFGSPRLEEKLTHPRLESFNQRLAGRFYLEPLHLEETKEFISALLEDSGGTPAQIFDDDAFAAIQQATDGVPRLINQLCDHAFVLAAVNGKSRITALDVESAWADIQQLPAPSSRETVAMADDRPGVVEFGALDEDPQAESDAASTSPTDQIETIEQQLEVLQHLQDQEEEPQQQGVRMEPTAAPQQPVFPRDSGGAFASPFDEPFQHEEIVIDQYASPDRLAKRGHRRVQCEQSKTIAAELDNILRAAPAT